MSVALGLGACHGVAWAQSTTGTIFGQAPVAAGETVTVVGPTGITREAQVDQQGRFRFANLPLGDYTVTLKRDGQVVETKQNIATTVGAGTSVSFGPSNVQSLESVSVTANALPSIDVSSVDSRTVITAQELSRLPLARSAEAIALLAPGAVQGSGAFGNVVSFGGSGVTENAYYINGYNSSDPLKNLGGVGLPYGAIDQQETYTGGYSARYGRSDGGVISQVGKRGTNEWHFGAQVVWKPQELASDPKNIYYPNAPLPQASAAATAAGKSYQYANTSKPGTLYRNREGNTSWSTTYSVYAGGPLIKDTLFAFVAAEAQEQKGLSTGVESSSAPANTHYTYHMPKVYAKLDWNINDNNIVEYTHISDKTQYEGTLYSYSYASRQEGGLAGYATSTKLSNQFDILKYTGYLTDDLTLSATYGRSKVTDYAVTPGLSTTLPYLSGVANQNPAIVGSTPIRNGVPTYVIKSPDAGSKTHGVRIDLDYKLGNHLLAAGIDNMTYEANDEGQAMGGPGYAWIYSVGDPNTAINSGLGVGAPGGKGYYVAKYIFSTTTSMSVEQKAFFLEDQWQISDRWMVKMGLRNDHFTNENNLGQAYVDQKNQWAPRLGFSWDVFGDSTFKVFGNLGRYYLALPNSVAIRGASASTYTREYFSYTGIDASGNPTGLTALGPGPVSANGEYGVPPDPKTITATNLKSQYQDEMILGFQKQLNANWTYGVKGTVRKLEAAIDDVCDTDRMVAKAAAEGMNTADLDIRGCYIFNPGKTNNFHIDKLSGGSVNLQMSTADWGFTEGAKRKYYALDLFMEHPFDGKWMARFDYTFARSYGNTEGQVKSDIGQDDVSKTQDWDAAALMINSNGLLANDRRHQFKAYGSYQLTPEWIFSGAMRIQSGTPNSCLGYYLEESDPIGYGSAYHTCANIAWPPGKTTTPWTKKLDLSAQYRPSFAQNKLAFQVDVFNVTNERKPIQTDATFETGKYRISNTYGIGTYYQDPRYVRFSVSYDW